MLCPLKYSPISLEPVVGWGIGDEVRVLVFEAELDAEGEVSDELLVRPGGLTVLLAELLVVVNKVEVGVDETSLVSKVPLICVPVTEGDGCVGTAVADRD